MRAQRTNTLFSRSGWLWPRAHFLAGTRGGHFVLSAPLQRRQLCSFEEISEAAETHGVSFGSMSSGLITLATTAAMVEISSPLDSMDFGTFEYRGHLRLHRSSGAVAQPGSFQPGGGGVPLGLVASRVVVTTDASTLGWGAVCEGMPASGLWSEPQTRWHIKRL